MAPAIPLIVVSARTSVAFLSSTQCQYASQYIAINEEYIPEAGLDGQEGLDRRQKVTGWRRAVLPQRTESVQVIGRL